MKCGTYSKPCQVTPVASQVIVRLITDVQCSTSAVARSRQRNHSKTNGNSFLQRCHRPYNSNDEGSNCTALFNCTVLQLYCTVQLYRTPTVLHSQRIHRTAQRQSELSSYTSNYTTPSRVLTAPCYAITAPYYDSYRVNVLGMEAWKLLLRITVVKYPLRRRIVHLHCIECSVVHTRNGIVTIVRALCQ